MSGIRHRAIVPSLSGSDIHQVCSFTSSLSVSASVLPVRAEIFPTSAQHSLPSIYPVTLQPSLCRLSYFTPVSLCLSVSLTPKTFFALDGALVRMFSRPLSGNWPKRSADASSKAVGQASRPVRCSDLFPSTGPVISVVWLKYIDIAVYIEHLHRGHCSAAKNLGTRNASAAISANRLDLPSTLV